MRYPFVSQSFYSLICFFYECIYLMYMWIKVRCSDGNVSSVAFHQCKLTDGLVSVLATVVKRGENVRMKIRNGHVAVPFRFLI